MFGFGKEKRATVEQMTSSDPRLAVFLGLGLTSSSGEIVTIESALGVPAVWASVNFLAGTLAGLPLNVYRKNGNDRKRVTNGLGPILHDAVNDEMSSFEWRKYTFEQALTHGRGVSFIERNDAGAVLNLWPLDPTKLTVTRKGGRKQYKYDDGERKLTYQAAEVIDLPMMTAADMLRVRSPIVTNRDVIGLAQAATKYGAKFFANGGVPPFAITGPIKTSAGLQRAADDLSRAVDKASAENRSAVALPDGHDIKQIGSDPEKLQFVELQRFLVEQIARIYSLPPTFLQDLTHGTFSNTEQQDLHFVKHTLRRWVEQFEQELNLKILGRKTNNRYIEMNVDGLLRGDFKTRMEGYAVGIQNSILVPNEPRRRENLPDIEGGDIAFIQGATVPVSNQINKPKEGDDGA